MRIYELHHLIPRQYSKRQNLRTELFIPRSSANGIYSLYYLLSCHTTSSNICELYNLYPANIASGKIYLGLTDFFVVRQHSGPKSGIEASFSVARQHSGLYILHQFRILGVSHTDELTLIILHILYPQNSCLSIVFDIIYKIFKQIFP